MSSNYESELDEMSTALRAHMYLSTGRVLLPTVATNNNNNELKALEARITALERKHYNCPDNIATVDQDMKRAREEIEQLGLYSAQWEWVPSSYYAWSLEERATCLHVPSTSHLCKALLMENKKVPAQTDDKTNPKFVFIIIQYETTLDTKKLTTAMRKLRSDIKLRLNENDFDFRIASEEDNDRITGYQFNSVSPFGLPQYTNENIPVILSAQIIKDGLAHFFMGGGHVDLKLSLSVTDFIKAKNPMIADISQPRITIPTKIATSTKVNNEGAATNNQKGTSNSNNNNKKQNNKQKQKQPKNVGGGGTPAAVGGEYNIAALDIRIGKIIKVWEHEKADKLFCEQIDVGEKSGPRNIASGLRPFYTQEELQDQYVLVLCNLKKRNLVGFPSHGMVLCASNADHTVVKLVTPPGSSPVIGERVFFAGYDDADIPPEPENRVAKKKIFEKLAPDFKTNAEGVVMWKNATATSSNGIIADCMPNAQVA